MAFNEELDLSALKSAFTAYENMLKRANMIESKKKEELEFYEFESAQAGLIQHFEFSFELSWKFVERFLVLEGLPSTFTRKGLFREGVRLGLILDFDEWVRYNNDRNRTSHTYDAVTADQVYQTAKKFFPEFKRFIKALESSL